MRIESVVLIANIAKALRTFGFGAVSVILGVFLAHRGFSAVEIGGIFSLSLIEDAIVTALACSAANRFTSRNVLLCFSVVLIVGALILSFATSQWLIALACILGVLSPSGFEGGPFSAVEQALVSHAVPAGRLTKTYSNYNLVGFAGAALGALAAGVWTAAAGKGAYTGLFLLFAAGGVGLMALYALLPSEHRNLDGQHDGAIAKIEPAARKVEAEDVRHKKLVYKLAGLQSLDSLGGGFVVQSLISYWFSVRFHVGAEFLGPVFFATNVLAAASFLLAPIIAARVGLLRTMVWTHLPCSLSLMLMPVLPSAGAAAGLLIARSLFSSMDVPVRQAFLMMLVPKEERTAATGITNGARAIAQGISPMFSGALLTSSALVGASFLCAGALKSIYDISLFVAFRNIELHEHPPETPVVANETEPQGAVSSGS